MEHRLARLQKQRQRERDGQETRREQARMHQQTSRAHETSQRRSVNYDKLWIPCIRHGVAAFCHSTVYRSAKA